MEICRKFSHVYFMSDKRFKDCHILLTDSDEEKLQRVVKGRFASASDFFRQKLREEVV